MKDVILILSLLLTFICYSCKSDDEPSLANEGSMRDWKYPAANVKVYKDGEIQSSVTEITVRSLQLSSGEEAIYNPQYDTTLKIKGLQKKNKITHVRVHSTIDDFTGATTLNGREYYVTGEYIGNPFETHYSQLKIEVRFESKQ